MWKRWLVSKNVSHLMIIQWSISRSRLRNASFKYQFEVFALSLSKRRPNTRVSSPCLAGDFFVFFKGITNMVHKMALCNCNLSPSSNLSCSASQRTAAYKMKAPLTADPRYLESLLFSNGTTEAATLNSTVFRFFRLKEPVTSVIRCRAHTAPTN